MYVVTNVVIEDQIATGCAANACAQGKLEEVATRRVEVAVLHCDLHYRAGALTLQEKAVVSRRGAHGTFGEIVKRDAVETAVVDGVDYAKVVLDAALNGGVGDTRRSGQFIKRHACFIYVLVGPIRAVYYRIRHGKDVHGCSANAEVLMIVDLHPRQRNVRYIIQEDANALRSAPVTAGLVGDGATRSRGRAADD